MCDYLASDRLFVQREAEAVPTFQRSPDGLSRLQVAIVFIVRVESDGSRRVLRDQLEVQLHLWDPTTHTGAIHVS